MSPQNWALATFFIPIASAIAYGIWLVVSAVDLAHSTRAETLVRGGALLCMAVTFGVIPRPWSRAIGVASFFALLLALTAMLQFEVFRGA